MTDLKHLERIKQKLQRKRDRLRQFTYISIPLLIVTLLVVGLWLIYTCTFLGIAFFTLIPISCISIYYICLHYEKCDKKIHKIKKIQKNQQILNCLPDDWEKIPCLKDINNPVYDLLLNEYVIAIYVKKHFDNGIKLKIVYDSKEGQKDLELSLTLKKAKKIINLDDLC